MQLNIALMTYEGHIIILPAVHVFVNTLRFYITMTS